MPTICVFGGLKITIYYNDHNPPHFHVEYSGQRARVVIADGRLLDSTPIPARKLKLIEAWRAARLDQLNDAWEAARDGHPLAAIEALP